MHGKALHLPSGSHGVGQIAIETAGVHIKTCPAAQESELASIRKRGLVRISPIWFTVALLSFIRQDEQTRWRHLPALIIALAVPASAYPLKQAHFCI